MDFYHAWPAYDARRGGFPLDVFRAGSCGYYDNFRGITPDGAWSFDFGRHVRVTGSPTRFLLPMGATRAKEVLAQADGQGRLLLRVRFRYAGKVARPCEPGGGPLPWNIVEVLEYEVYPPPAAWREPPDPGRRLAVFPAARSGPAGAARRYHSGGWSAP